MAEVSGVWRSRVLEFLGGHAAEMVADLAGLVRVPSISGDASLAHAPRESVPVSELLTAARALTLVVLEHCGVR